MFKTRIFLMVIITSTLWSGSACSVEYELDTGKSKLSFVSTKQLHVSENFEAKKLSGSIGEDGTASLVIDLNQIETGIAIRNERMRIHLFETVIFDKATITLSVDHDNLSALKIGESMMQSVTADIDLHGIVASINADLVIHKVHDSEILVRNRVPVLIKAEDFNLVKGINLLKDIGNLESIGYVVPVSFILFYSVR